MFTEPASNASVPFTVVNRTLSKVAANDFAPQVEYIYPAPPPLPPKLPRQVHVFVELESKDKII